jgi:predicted nucleic acid-binding Zn ribbon protein
MKGKERIKKIKNFASEIVIIARIIITFAIMFARYCLEKCRNIFLPKINRAQKMIIFILYLATTMFFLALSSFKKERGGIKP